MTMVIDSMFDIGYSKPASCWLIEDSTSTGDELIMCYIVTIVPILLWNSWLLNNATEQQGLMEKVLKPYIRRMNFYIIVSILSVTFEVTTTFLSATDTFQHLRGSRANRYFNLCINLISLLCQTFVIVVSFNVDIFIGIKQLTIYPVLEKFGYQQSDHFTHIDEKRMSVSTT